MDPSSIQTKEKPIEDPNALYLEKGEIVDDVTYDAVFGEITDEGPNYRNIGLGVLSIPTAFDTLGMVPGVIVLIAISCITTWSDYMVGSFKLRHREVYGIDDAGALMFGLTDMALDWIFVAGSGILGISIGLNAVSTHGACTAIFVAVAAILGFACSSIRTLGKITWLAWIGLPCILIASKFPYTCVSPVDRYYRPEVLIQAVSHLSLVLIVTIAVGVQDRPPTAPQTDGPWVADFKIIGNPTFAQAITAVSSLVFAFSGTPGFFSIVSEMRDPRKFTPALLICQAVVTAVYITIGCVVYYYCGSYVASPALGSAGGLIKKIAYGLSLPGLIVTTTIVTHVSRIPLIICCNTANHLRATYRSQRNISSSICFAAPNTSSRIPVEEDPNSAPQVIFSPDSKSVPPAFWIPDSEHSAPQVFVPDPNEKYLNPTVQSYGAHPSIPNHAANPPLATGQASNKKKWTWIIATTVAVVIIVVAAVVGGVVGSRNADKDSSSSDTAATAISSSSANNTTSSSSTSTTLTSSSTTSTDSSATPTQTDFGATVHMYANDTCGGTDDSFSVLNSNSQKCVVVPSNKRSIRVSQNEYVS
ncbi:unnamed protein product [Aspergillus oryzae]|nr:unnamed protein product [Aspergillus oryzae]